MGSNSPLLCSGLNICHSGRTEVSKTSLHAVKQCVFLVLLPFSWDETSMWLDWNTLISTKLPVLKKYDNIRDLGIIATLVIKLLLSHALLARAAEVWRDKSCLRTPAVGGGLFFLSGAGQKGEKNGAFKARNLSSWPNNCWVINTDQQTLICKSHVLLQGSEVILHTEG